MTRQVDTDGQLLQLLLVNLAAFLGAFVQVATGLGFAMLAVPLLAVISLDYVPGPTLFVSVFLAMSMVASGRAAIVREELVAILPGLTVGTVAGAVVIASTPAASLGVLFAILILLAVAITVFVRPVRLSVPALIGGGFVAGLMGTVSGIHGPPLAVLYQREDIEKIRATMAVVFAIAYVISLFGLAAAGQFDLYRAWLGLTMLPGLVLGILIARRMRGSLPTGLVRLAMLSLVVASAVLLLVKSVW